MAAMGMVSLKYLDRDNSYRRQLAAWYKHEFKGEANIQIIDHENWSETSQHLIQVMVQNRDEVIAALNESEIYPGVHYELSTNHPVYKRFDADLPNAETFASQILSLPCHMFLTQGDVKRVCSALKEIVYSKR